MGIPPTACVCVSAYRRVFVCLVKGTFPSFKGGHKEANILERKFDHQA